MNVLIHIINDFKMLFLDKKSQLLKNFSKAVSTNYIDSMHRKWSNTAL